jgi:hypothetical protein
MAMIDLTEKTDLLIVVGTNWYKKILSYSDEIRQDEKKRTGIQVFIQEPETRNANYASIINPSRMAKILVVEKATRANVLGHFSSQNSRDPERMRFEGAVTARFDGITIQASTSGLQGPEDVLVSVMILASIFEKTALEICTNIAQNGGELPHEFFEIKNYLFKLLNE